MVLLTHFAFNHLISINYKNFFLSYASYYWYRYSLWGKMVILILLAISGFLGKRSDEIKKNLTALADKYPDLRDAYNVKIESAFNFQQNYQNRELVVQILNDLEKTFDEMERTLKKVTEGK